MKLMWFGMLRCFSYSLHVCFHFQILGAQDPGQAPASDFVHTLDHMMFILFSCECESLIVHLFHPGNLRKARIGWGWHGSARFIVARRNSALIGLRAGPADSSLQWSVVYPCAMKPLSICPYILWYITLYHSFHCRHIFCFVCNYVQFPLHLPYSSHCHVACSRGLLCCLIPTCWCMYAHGSSQGAHGSFHLSSESHVQYRSTLVTLYSECRNSQELT